MYKTRLLICILLYLVPCRRADAQYQPFFVIPEGEKKRTFYGGLAAGVNFSQVDGDTYSGYHKIGINAGPLVYVRFSQMLSASMELLYTRKGSKARSFRQNAYGIPYQDQYDLKLNYVEVPVLLHLYIHGRFHYGAGISYARLINAKEEAYAVYPVNIYPEVNYFKKQDISALGELAYEIYNGFFASLRFNYSLQTIRDAERIPEGYGGGKSSAQLNNMWSLRFVYLVR